MNYTKGEWKVEVIDAHHPKYHKVYARINPSIGYVGWKAMGVYDDPGVGKRQLKTLNEEALANAHLIAASPLMYEALRRFLESSACTNNCDPDDMTCDTNFARKALAKAEGKESNGK